MYDNDILTIILRNKIMERRFIPVTPLLTVDTLIIIMEKLSLSGVKILPSRVILRFLEAL